MSPKTPPGHFKILYFASATTLTRMSSETLPAPLKLAELFPALEKKYPGITHKVLDSAAITVNLEYMDSEDETVVINEGDEVAVIPPVSSG